MVEHSAGILLYRMRGDGTALLLAHPGGPFWAKKDDGTWSIPKGLLLPDEAPRTAALREFEEETGFAPAGPLLELGSFRQPSGKIIHAWAAEGDFDPAALRSNLFSLEWPPRSGVMREFPEIDRAAWFSPAEAMRKILRGQQPIVATLLQQLGLPDTLLS